MSESPPSNLPTDNRNFGLLVGGVFLLIGLWPLWHQLPVRLWATYLGAGLIVAGLLLPAMLAPARAVWMRIGHVLGFINTRLILSVVFFVLITPIGLLLRLFGKDPLERRPQGGKVTYWQTKPPNDTHQSMKQQF